MSKSPFELRTEILALTKDYMDKQWEANKELADRMIKAGPHNSDEVKKLMEMYSPDALLKQADEFYQKFVCDKGDK